MMKVTYSDKIKRSGNQFVMLEQITKRIEEVTGPYSEEVHVEWQRSEDDKNYILRLSAWNVSAATSLEPEELESSVHMRVRLYRLWGELLDAHIDKLLDRKSVV